MSNEFTPTKEVTIVTTRRWEITTETIEALLVEKLGLVGTKADFDWDCSSGGLVRGITVTTKTSSTKTG